MPCLKSSLEQDGNLGPDAARARNRPPCSAARCAGWGGIGKTLESPRESRFRRCTGRLNATQPGVLAVSPPYIRGLAGRVQGKRRRADATLTVIHRSALSCRLTLWFYCGKRAARRHANSLASRANHRVLLGCALLCAAALLCADVSPGRRRRSAVAGRPSAPAGFPIASDARLAGDGKQTRFILDLDKTITFRAFALADPYRVVVDIPQVNFRLPAGTGAAGRGLIKAFRYGLVMPGGSRIVFDLTGPAQDRQFLCARCGQRPAAAAGAGIRGGRPHHLRAVARRAKAGPN